MSTNEWTRIDEGDYLHCCPDAYQHEIYYYRKYTVGTNFWFSPTNDLISNFQKGPTAPEKVLPYREMAINKFVEDLEKFVCGFPDDLKMYFVPTPPSKVRTSPHFDPRVEEVALRLQAKNPRVNVAICIDTVQSIVSTKQNTQSRSADNIYNNLIVDTSKLPPDKADTAVLILDDVLTSGSHFEGMRRRLRDHLTDAIIGGVFWAKAVARDLA